MMNMLETYDVKVKTAPGKDKTITSKIDLKERAMVKGKGGKGKKDVDEDVNEMVDRKIEKVYERVRNDNWIIWKESIRLAEKEFSEGGVKKTMDFLPKVYYDKNDLKRTINTLMFDDSEQRPKPIVKISRDPTPPRKEKPKEQNKSPQKASSKDESIKEKTNPKDSKKSDDKIPAKGSEKNVDKSIDKNNDKERDKSADRSLDKSADRSLDKSADKSLDKSNPRSSKQSKRLDDSREESKGRF